MLRVFTFQIFVSAQRTINQHLSQCILAYIHIKHYAHFSKLLISHIENPSNDLNVRISSGAKILNVRVFSFPLLRKNCKLIRARMKWIRESSRREHVNSLALHNSTVTNTDGSRRKSGIYRATCVSFPFRWVEKYRDIVVGGCCSQLFPPEKISKRFLRLFQFIA